MAEHKKLINARVNKNDEFYTQLSDIEKELKHYKEHFKDKIIFCNCDDPEYSEFYNYFHLNFEELGLKKLICTHYDREKPTYKLEIEGDINGDGKIDGSDVVKTRLLQNGDFRSEECIELLKEVDIVVTNPPFSLFREYIDQLIKYEKKFIIWGNNNSITYKEIFSLLKENKIWLGYMANSTCIFKLPDEYEKYDKKITEEKNDGNKYGKVPSISIFTNLDIQKRHEKLVLQKNYIHKEYPTYNNYNAIDVNKVSNIPKDYDGIMGVPITFLSKYNPEQFEIIGIGMGEHAKKLGITTIGKDFLDLYFKQGNKGNYCENNVICCYTDINGKAKIPYARVLIKRK